MRIRCLIVFGAVLFASVGHAANIEKLPAAGDGLDVIAVTGVIEDGDDEKFRTVAASSSQALVMLESQGGSVSSALEIGRAIRLRGFATYVGANTLCASACALIWLAGDSRQFVVGAMIGFHASYVLTDGKPVEKGVGNALIGAYLNQIGLSQEAIVFVTSAPPEGMEWLTVEKAGRIGIALTQVKPSLLTAGAQPEPYNPLNTVTEFYSALAAADGQTASALVIPEKRGIGPFNEDAIRSFFGSMLTPLEVTSVTKNSDNLFEVSYTYVDSKGTRCDGRSHVQTVYVFGTTLIQKILALSGC